MEIINQYGYFGIFLLITIENVFPADTIGDSFLPLGILDYICTVMSEWGVVLAATIGSVAGQ